MVHVVPSRRMAFTAAMPVARSPWLGTAVGRGCPRRVRMPVVGVGRRIDPRMMFDTLSEKMSEAVRKMRGTDKISEKNVASALKDVKRALLDADVNLRVVNGLIKEVKQRAIGVEVLPGVDPGQMLVKVMFDALAEIMGKDQTPLAKRADSQPTVVLLAGLQGAGKTTAAAKLALWCKKEQRKVLMIAADVYRPAAIEQLQTLGGMIEVDVFSLGVDQNPREIVRRGIEEAKKMKVDTVIVDTAGRQVIDDRLMNELKDVKKVCEADETLLVVDAMTGQEAANVAKMFNEAVGISGAILTKMDGDTRGGAALSVQRVSGAPIKFVGVGEKVEKLEPFYPERMASRILGMGDVLTLVDKAQEEMDEKEAEKMTRKMMEAKFDFDDFLKQTRLISRMGSFGGVMKMLPGIGGELSEDKMRQAELKLKVADSLIKSMTKQERSEPELLFASPTATSRIRRIAKGSGRSLVDAKSLISDFQKMRTMMQRMSKKMVGGADGGPGEGGPGMLNRAQRRKAAKKKAVRGGGKRGFG